VFNWDRNPAFRGTEQALLQAGIVHSTPRWGVTNPTAFDDLVCSLFTAWALTAIGQRLYSVCFVPLDERHTLLVVRHSPSRAIFPALGNVLFADDFLHEPKSLAGLRSKLLFNASLSPQAAHLKEEDFVACRDADSLRRLVTQHTVAQPDVYGWLFGGCPILLRVPPKTVEALLTAGTTPDRLLSEAFEQLLCLKLGVEIQAPFFSCHIQQTTPLRFNELDVVLYFPSPASQKRGLWKPDSRIPLERDIRNDKLFILENSIGIRVFGEVEYRTLTEGASQPQRAQLLDTLDDLLLDTRHVATRLKALEQQEPLPEPERDWHPKLINLWAFRLTGFRAVKLHLCSLAEMNVTSAPLQKILRDDPLIEVSHLPPSFVTNIRDNTWTPDGMRQACKKYITAALCSVRALKKLR
jgi:hypothetical protein